MAKRKIFIVINPAAGKAEPVLSILNSVFTEHEIEWDVGLTHHPGDATRLAQEAADKGYDVIAGYGGDGTQMEVVNGLMGRDALFGLLPGGTGNAMAFELGIPRDLRLATELLCQSETTREVDLGQACGKKFLLRAYTGPKPEHVASREEKDRWGLLAYPMATLRVFRNLNEMNFKITIDGKSFEESGLACFVFNAGSSGGIPANIPSVSVSDGLLDVFLLSAQAHSPLALASYFLEAEDANTHAHYWTGKSIEVTPEQVQNVWLDGEAAGQTPCTFTVLPGTVKVIVPAVLFV